MANCEKLNNVKFYSKDKKYIDSYNSNIDIQNAHEITNLIENVYYRNAHIFISNRIYGKNYEMIKTIIIDDTIIIEIE